LKIAPGNTAEDVFAAALLTTVFDTVVPALESQYGVDPATFTAYAIQTLQGVQIASAAIGGVSTTQPVEALDDRTLRTIGRTSP